MSTCHMRYTCPIHTNFSQNLQLPFVRPTTAAFNANQDFLSHNYLPNDVVNDGKLPVTILDHKAASSGALSHTPTLTK
ncbi:hypothetical protein ANI02nite_34560 [Acetobacter nitrogenifigens DSM 23921 = NBRC 105050]|uniref:Uncharacterized protein n=1 Tax=Acetobacter nitrogenifigens DSM 23921 = NBRC 105050 TaxID=1120919 RepID=A0A511XF33_9PROT|nr:hypothetical protein ANI02nite_34560 [Acetobacter nitrogenifigens DSM 23921 = NBRC 105050]